MLPNGAMKQIAAKANIPYTEVSRMFNGLNTKRTPIVVKATTEYLAELEVQRTKAVETLQKELSK